MLIPEIGVTTTVREILQRRLPPIDQLGMVGMTINSDARWAFDDDPKKREEARFRVWLHAQMVCLDSFWDLPARRMTNGEFAAALASRTSADCALADKRDRRAAELVNSLMQHRSTGAD